MKRRNLERDEKVISRLMEGIPPRQVAEEFGLSRQMVYSIRSHYEQFTDNKDEITIRNMRGVKKIIYPEIRNYLMSNKIPLNKLCLMIDEVPAISGTVTKFLWGVNKKVSIDAVKKILDVTGMPFEVAFCTNESN